MSDTTPATTEQHTICPYGDLKLRVKSSTITTTYLVSSHQLCNASPVFRRRIPDPRHYVEEDLSLEDIDFRGSQAATPSGSDDSRAIHEIDIDDKVGINPTTMAVVLYVIHARAEHIPETITFEEIRDIAVFCDHYCCAGVVSPWNMLWMKRPELQELVLRPGYEDWLFIAHVFGDQEVFGKVTKRLARDVVKVEEEELGVTVTIGDRVKKMDSRLPEQIFHDIAAEHVKAVENILSVCRQTYDLYHDNTTIKCKHGQKYCDRIVFSSLHLELTQLGLLSRGHIRRIQRGQEYRSLYSMIDDFKNVWSSIRQSLAKVSVDCDHQADCVEPPEEKVKIFDSCLDNIASLTLESYHSVSGYHERKTSAGALTWNGVIEQDVVVQQPSYKFVQSFNKYVSICAYGDLEITYSSVQITFRVSSHAVRSASPILRDLMEKKRGFRAGRKSSYGDDDSPQLDKLRVSGNYDATVLTVVFYAIHGLGKKIPNAIDVSQLYEIAAVCEELRCVTIVQPWCNYWVEKLRPTVGKPENGGWLYIAWVFGLDDIFQTVTRRFLTSGFAGGYGRYIILEDEKHSIELGEHISREVIRKIYKCEGTARKGMEEVCRNLYDRYRNPSTHGCLLSSDSAAAKVCSRLVFADLYWGFKSINMMAGDEFKIPNTIPLTTVVRDINKVLSPMDAIPQITGPEDDNHFGCAREVEDTNTVVQRIFDEMKLDLAMCGWVKESRESVVDGPDNGDYY
ncbi:hypothetical protein BDD12DRAFT_938688 [Trichophaea hybrida]|nr:hypothetical protein BDD12DRAFT_938688 [Trichophaea hybrida]